MASSEFFTSTTSNLIGGESDIISKSVTIASGDLADNTVLGQITATGEYVASATGLTNGAEKPVAILVEAVDATNSSVVAPVFVGGVFNPDELVWDTSFTDINKLTAFSGTNITLSKVK